MEDTYREIMAIPQRRARVEVAEYERKLYVRAGRRVVAIYNPDNFSVEARKPRTREEANVLNEVLEAASIEREAVEVPVSDPTKSVVESIYLWQTGHARTAIEEREDFSCLTQCSLTCMAALDDHEAAMEAYWEVPE